MLIRNSFQRVLRKQVVVPVVTQRRRALRRVLQPRLVVLLEQRILLRHTVSNGRNLRQDNWAHERQGNGKDTISHTPKPSSPPCTRPEKFAQRLDLATREARNLMKTRLSCASNTPAGPTPSRKMGGANILWEPYP